jgi:hypothetical protein
MEAQNIKKEDFTTVIIAVVVFFVICVVGYFLYDSTSESSKTKNESSSSQSPAQSPVRSPSTPSSFSPAQSPVSSPSPVSIPSVNGFNNNMIGRTYKYGQNSSINIISNNTLEITINAGFLLFQNLRVSYVIGNQSVDIYQGSYVYNIRYINDNSLTFTSNDPTISGQYNFLSSSPVSVTMNLTNKKFFHIPSASATYIYNFNASSSGILCYINSVGTQSNSNFTYNINQNSVTITHASGNSLGTINLTYSSNPETLTGNNIPGISGTVTMSLYTGSACT